MGMQITPEERESALKGFFIADCAVRDVSTFTFLLLQDQADAAGGDKRLLTYFPHDEDDRLDWTTYEGFSGPKLAASTTPKNQAIMVSRNRLVAALGGGDDDMETPIPKETIFSCFDLVTINGSIYAAGPWRTVCKRVGPNQWESLIGDRSTLPLPPKVGASNDGGFDAIDGFSATDIYCVGGKGDAWRYDGHRWFQCVVPTNMYFKSVCCAGDGYVYIGMQSGSVMRGREDSWEIIHRDEMTLPFKDMVWYDGKVWCTSDYGLWVIENGKLKEADVPPEVKACSGNLSVGDGVMLLAGMYGATVYDGREWQRIL
ncbi:hypothetical protein [Paracidovorax avenae]|uniref:hypothetical protein n=1 Tax=Paracidovorax avenae TaxID=80867 RepID=UPI001F2FFF73|nr:hypothetical protein [Paracidovorax avenae]